MQSALQRPALSATAIREPNVGCPSWRQRNASQMALWQWQISSWETISWGDTTDILVHENWSSQGSGSHSEILEPISGSSTEMVLYDSPKNEMTFWLKCIDKADDLSVGRPITRFDLTNCTPCVGSKDDVYDWPSLPWCSHSPVLLDTRFLMSTWWTTSLKISSLSIFGSFMSSGTFCLPKSRRLSLADCSNVNLPECFDLVE